MRFRWSIPTMKHIVSIYADCTYMPVCMYLRPSRAWSQDDSFQRGSPCEKAAMRPTPPCPPWKVRAGCVPGCVYWPSGEATTQRQSRSISLQSRPVCVQGAGTRYPTIGGCNAEWVFRCHGRITFGTAVFKTHTISGFLFLVRTNIILIRFRFFSSSS